MNKIEVVKELCIGCGACVAIDPEHFDFNNEGISNVISNENLESTTLKEAMEACPTSAIKFMEIDENTCNCETDGTCNCEPETCNCDHCEENCTSN